MAWDWTPDLAGLLERFLEDRGLTEGALSIRAIGDGHSNLTYLVSDGERNVVVRRPPPPPTPPGANDMLREARLLTALEGTAVPVPCVLATADAGDVLDVPLYVMSYVQGPVVTTETPAPLDNPGSRLSVAHSLIDTLADLHAVDWRGAGLGEFGRPEGFNARHLQRMAGLLKQGKDGGSPPEFAEIESWLTEHLPPESDATLVHCDFRIGNVIVSPEPPEHVKSVLDWELATIGDPLLDVGYFLATIPEPGKRMNPTAELSAAMLEPGYPSRSEMATRYRARTGRDLSELSWYTTLALWKLAVLYEYSRRRVVSGGDPYYADPSLVQRFLVDARQSSCLDDAASTS